MNEKILAVMKAAQDVLWNESHDNCGEYAVNPKKNHCALCALELALREAHPEYERVQKIRTATPAGHDPSRYAKRFIFDTYPAITERPHGLVNALEREIIDLNQLLHDWLREHNMYRNAWCREIGGFIVRKTHEIDGFVLRTRDALNEAEERGRKKALAEQVKLKEIAPKSGPFC